MAAAIPLLSSLGTAAGGAAAAAPAVAGAAASQGGLLSGLLSKIGGGGGGGAPNLQVPQGAALTAAGGGGFNAGGPLSNTGQSMPMSQTQQFDTFMAQASPQATPETSSDLGEFGQKFASKGLQSLGNYDRRLTDMIYPGRSTNRWQPNENPGLSGLMRQLEYTYPRGLGRR